MERSTKNQLISVLGGLVTTGVVLFLSLFAGLIAGDSGAIGLTLIIVIYGAIVTMAVMWLRVSRHPFGRGALIGLIVGGLAGGLCSALFVAGGGLQIH